MESCLPPLVLTTPVLLFLSLKRLIHLSRDIALDARSLPRHYHDQHPCCLPPERIDAMCSLSATGLIERTHIWYLYQPQEKR